MLPFFVMGRKLIGKTRGTSDKKHQFVCKIPKKQLIALMIGRTVFSKKKLKTGGGGFKSQLKQQNVLIKGLEELVFETKFKMFWGGVIFIII